MMALPKPRRFLPKSTKRLPKVEDVTIAAGLLCKEAVVICADTQETIPGYIKQHHGKVRSILYRNGFRFAVTGAGASDYIEAACEQAFDRLEPQNMTQVQDALRERLQSFFDSHLTRWASFAESERPSVELLIGAAGNNSRALFHYSGTALNRVIDAKAIGAGILLANSLLSQHHSVNHTPEQTISIAVYILAKVKNQVDTCGGNSDMVVLAKNGDFAWAEFKPIEELEKEFLSIEKEWNKELTQKIMERQLPLEWLEDIRGKKADKRSNS